MKGRERKQDVDGGEKNCDGLTILSHLSRKLWSKKAVQFAEFGRNGQAFMPDMCCSGKNGALVKGVPAWQTVKHLTAGSLLTLITAAGQIFPLG